MSKKAARQLAALREEVTVMRQEVHALSRSGQHCCGSCHYCAHLCWQPDIRLLPGVTWVSNETMYASNSSSMAASS